MASAEDLPDPHSPSMEIVMPSVLLCSCSRLPTRSQNSCRLSSSLHSPKPSKTLSVKGKVLVVMLSPGVLVIGPLRARKVCDLEQTHHLAGRKMDVKRHEPG